MATKTSGLYAPYLWVSEAIYLCRAIFLLQGRVATVGIFRIRLPTTDTGVGPNSRFISWADFGKRM